MNKPDLPSVLIIHSQLMWAQCIAFFSTIIFLLTVSFLRSCHVQNTTDAHLKMGFQKDHLYFSNENYHIFFY